MKIDPELGYVLLMISSVALFALGGKYWKGLRRYVLPCVVVGILHCFMGVGLYTALAVGATICGVTHLPYGDGAPWDVRVGVFTSYALPSIWLVKDLWFEFVVMLVVTGGLLTIAFIGSRNKRFQWCVKWKVWEMLAGFLVIASMVPQL